MEEANGRIVAPEDVSVTVVVVAVLSDLGGIFTVLFTDGVMEKVFLLSYCLAKDLFMFV